MLLTFTARLQGRHISAWLCMWTSAEILGTTIVVARRMFATFLEEKFRQQLTDLCEVAIWEASVDYPYLDQSWLSRYWSVRICSVGSINWSCHSKNTLSDCPILNCITSGRTSLSYSYYHVKSRVNYTVSSADPTYAAAEVRDCSGSYSVFIWSSTRIFTLPCLLFTWSSFQYFSL